MAQKCGSQEPTVVCNTPFLRESKSKTWLDEAKREKAAQRRSPDQKKGVCDSERGAKDYRLSSAQRHKAKRRTERSDLSAASKPRKKRERSPASSFPIRLDLSRRIDRSSRRTTFSMYSQVEQVLTMCVYVVTLKGWPGTYSNSVYTPLE